jgi:hypothetical protein
VTKGSDSTNYHSCLRRQALPGLHGMTLLPAGVPGEQGVAALSDKHGTPPADSPRTVLTAGRLFVALQSAQPGEPEASRLKFPI